MTSIAVGGTTDESTLLLSAFPGDPDTGQPLKLQVEVRPTGTPFSGAFTAESGFVLIADYPWAAPYEDVKLKPK